jgi:hypothetical protein
MKLLIMQFSPTSCHFIPLWSKYSKVIRWEVKIFDCNSGQANHAESSIKEYSVLTSVFRTWLLCSYTFSITERANHVTFLSSL